MEKEITTVIDLDLTPAERRLLDVLLDPKNKDITQAEKAEKADINRTTFYQIVARPRFREAIKLLGVSTFYLSAIPIVNKMVAEAKAGKYLQQRAILDACNITPSKSQEINIDNRSVNIEVNDSQLEDISTRLKSITAYLRDQNPKKEAIDIIPEEAEEENIIAKSPKKENG